MIAHDRTVVESWSESRVRMRRCEVPRLYTVKATHVRVQESSIPARVGITYTVLGVESAIGESLGVDYDCVRGKPLRTYPRG
jgi:hypothetical protein